MSSDKAIDYTTFRKGARTAHGRIVVCPKCGRKGALLELRTKHGATDLYFHKVGIVGAGSDLVDGDRCEVPVGCPADRPVK